MRLIKTHFFYPFCLPPGSFERLRAKNPEHKKADAMFQPTEQIRQSDPRTYAEYVYFHPHARDLLFGPIKEQRSVLAYEVPNEKIRGWKFRVKLPPRNDVDQAIEKILGLADVHVMFYDLGVAVLSFSVYWDYRIAEGVGLSGDFSFDDLLDLNNLVRRRAPSFIDTSTFPVNGPTPNNVPAGSWAGIQKAQRELAEAISIESPDKVQAMEDFGDSFDEVFSSASKTPYVGNHFQFWLDRIAVDLGLDVSESTPILDERGFVHSFVLADRGDTAIDGGASELPDFASSPENVFGKLTDEPELFRSALLRLLAVDPAGKDYVANPGLRDSFLSNWLYLRYRDESTYMGFTRCSGVFLLHADGPRSTPPIGAADPEGFTRSVLLKHFDSMYFQMACLLLVYRAGLLDLSHRCTMIAQRVSSPEDLDKRSVGDDIERLRSDFLRFHTKYWSCEITAQEQGIEMFSLWNRNMDNEHLFSEVDQQIRALHEFSLATVNRRLGRLTYLNLSVLGVALLSVAGTTLTITHSTWWSAVARLGSAALLLGIIISLVLLWRGSWVIKKLIG
ncbi:MAG: hypothetical protein ABIK65_13015 [Candidatus Eisenbacteria bacterium]